MRLEDYKRARFAEDAELAALYNAALPVRNLAGQITALRTQRRLSQADLAERVGVKQSNISRLENAAHEPSIATLQRVCHALDADLVIQIVPRS